MRQNTTAVAVIAGLSLSACVANLPDTHPTGSEAVPAPVVIQVPAPAPPPPAAPTTPPPSSSNPAPTAPPPSSPPATSNSCSLGRGTGDGNNCPRTSPMFLDDVDRAAARVQAARPELIRGGRIPNELWNTYYAAMVQELQGMGYCAWFDGEEIAVKNTNSFNEQYHVILSNGSPRTGEGSYRSTCWPACF